MEQSTLRADGQVGECTGGAAPRKHSPRGLRRAQAEERRPDSTDGWNICLRTQIKWRWSRQWHTEPAQGTDQVRQEENEKGRRGLAGRVCGVSEPLVRLDVLGGRGLQWPCTGSEHVIPRGREERHSQAL